MPKRAIPNLRWYMALLLCLSTALNYLDRQTLSVLAATIQRELALSTVEYSYITSSFLASYTVMYAVAGRWVDRLGVRRGLIFFASGWSVANMLHALARTAPQLAFFRFLLGAAEPANFPAGVKAVCEWFPMRERALAIGLFNSGVALGAVLSTPLVTLIALNWGWRAAFVVTGALGFVWVALWAGLYRSPREHPRVTDAERALILEGGKEEASSAPVRLRRLLSLRETWGCVQARFLIDPVSYFLMFWIPKYLQQEHGMSLADLGKYGWIPFAAFAIGSVAGGAIPRWLIARGWSLNRARKTTMFTLSCLAPVWCFVIIRSHDAVAAMAALMALMFGHAAWANLVLPAEVFPAHVVATVSGLGGALGGVAGIASQLGIGWVVQNMSFAPVFMALASVYLLSFLLVNLMIGELGVIKPGVADT